MMRSVIVEKEKKKRRRGTSIILIMPSSIQKNIQKKWTYKI